MENANLLAYVAFWGSVPVVLALFWRLPASKAAALSIIGTAMFLPEAFEIDPPLIPPFDKETLPALAALIGALIWARRRLAHFERVDWLFVLLLIGTIGTVVNNRAAIFFFAGVVKDALSTFDVFAIWIRDFLQVFALFFLGRSLFTTREDLYTFAKVLAVGGLVYSLLILLEGRLSPQLHNWTYGYHQHRFDQTYRFGGYRPMVYMSHGLTNARFMLGCLIAMTALARARPTFLRVPSWLWVVYLVIILGFCRSAGAWVLGAVCLPIVAFTTARTQVRLATLLAVFVLAYPVLRAADYVPVSAVIDWAAENVGVERAQSLEDRFEQEELLLGKLRQRPIFGWGPERYNLWDEAVNQFATIDGEWLHTFGRRGMWGFFCAFALYLAPVWAARKHVRRLSPRDAKLVAGLTVLTAVFTFDNIPNSSGHLPQYFFAGVIYGAIGGLARQTVLEKRARRRKALLEREARREALAAGKP